jgi:hypothetical protein
MRGEDVSRADLLPGLREAWRMVGGEAESWRIYRERNPESGVKAALIERENECERLAQDIAERIAEIEAGE